MSIAVLDRLTLGKRCLLAFALLAFPASAIMAQDEEPALESPATSTEEAETLDTESPAAQPESTTTPATAEAQELLRQAFNASKTAKTEQSLTAMLETAQQALDKGGLDQANTEYLQRLMSWAHNQRGEVVAEDGREEDALADFEAAISMDPKRWQAYYNRGVSFGNLGQLEPALADFNRAIKMKPNFAKAYFNRGEVRFAQGDAAAAIGDYNQAIRLASNSSDAYNSRGFAYYSQRNRRAAMQDYDRAIRLDARNVNAYVNRGDAYADTGDYTRAANDYRAALRLDPRYGRAYLSWAWVMATATDPKFRDPQNALEYANKAIELDGDTNYRYLDVLAAAQAANGQFNEAAETQAQAVALAPPNQSGRYKERLKLYEAGRPYPDVRPATAQPNTRQPNTRQSNTRQPQQRRQSGPARRFPGNRSSR